MGAWAGAAFRPCANRGSAVGDNAVGGNAAIELGRVDNIGAGRADDIGQRRMILRRTDDVVLSRVVRMSDRAAIAMPLAAVPAMPAVAAAPAITRAPRVVAPVPARALPAVIVPAVIVAKEEELRLLDRKDLRRRKSAAHGGLGRARQRQGHARQMANASPVR